MNKVYVANKKKACEYIGITSRAYEFPEDTSEEEIEKTKFITFTLK